MLNERPTEFPGFDAEYEKHKDFFTKLGVPETPGDYKLEALADIPEDQIDKARLDHLLKAAHEAKIPQDLLNKLAQADFEYAKSMESTWAEQAEARQAELEGLVTQEWGTDVAKNAEAVKGVIESFGAEGFVDIVQQNMEVFMHPAVMNTLLNIGRAAQAATAPGGTATKVPGLVATADQASQELTRFFQNPENKQLYRSGDASTLHYVENLYKRGGRRLDLVDTV
jgi:hypothetical protein